MAIITAAILLSFVSGLLFGFVLGEKLDKSVKEGTKETLDFNKDGKVDLKDAQLALDLNKDGKVDTKDLEVAKTELKKTASQINKLAKKVK